MTAAASGRRPGEGTMDRLIPARERLLSRVRVLPNGCWEWTGFVTPDGYGLCGYQGRRGFLAHRALYLEVVGPIGDDLTLDHLCHTRDVHCAGGPQCQHRRCVNPGHLEPVPAEENSSRGAHARKTHCPRNHPYAGSNVVVRGGSRFCVECGRIRARESKARAKAARQKEMAV